MNHNNKSLIKGRLAASAATLAILAFGGAPLSAQVDTSDEAGSSAPEPVEQAALSPSDDVIIVTARRRSETLYSVPGSVSAFGEQQVSNLQAVDMRRVQYAVPNFHFEKSDSSNAAIYLRGIGQNDSLPFVESGVGVYIDDVYVARSQAAFLDLFDVERVEVLRGPQGTLYGRNSPGGAVKLITKQPGDTAEAYLELGTGNYGLATMSGRISGPLNEDASLRAKLSATATHRNGFSKNVVEGGRDGDTATVAFRGALVYEASSDLSFNLNFDGKLERPKRSLTPIRRTSLVTFPDPVGDPTGAVVFQTTEDAFGSPYVVEGTANDFADLTTFGVSLKSRLDLSDNWFVENIASYRRMSWDVMMDADNTPHPVLDIPVYEDDEQYSNELRISYDDGNGLAFTGGFFYFHDLDTVLAGFDDASAPLDLGFITVPIISFGIPSSGLGESRQTTDSYAAFADVTVPISSATSLELGLRYTYEEKEMLRRNEFFFDPNLSVSYDTPPFLTGVGFPGETLQGVESWDSLTPRAVLSHQIDDKTLVYASAARGFKSGGFPGRAASSKAFVPFRPETVWSYEGGIKMQRFDNKLSFAASYFYSDFKDIQLNGFGQDPDTGVFVTLFTNAASARIQGVEVSMSLRPLEGLTIDGTAGYLDAKYNEYEALVGGVLVDVSDRRLVKSPKWTGFLGATYKKPLTSELTGTLHFDGAYRGAHANETTDSPNLAVPETVYLNAFASLQARNGVWEVRVGGTNLTNKARAAQSFNTAEFSGVETAFMAPPRLYDIRLILRY